MATVVIVGAGPAGMAAAVSTAHAGCDTVVLDEMPPPEGQRHPSTETVPSHSHCTVRPNTPSDSGRIEALSKSTGTLRYVPYAAVIAGFEGPEIHYVHEDTTQTLRPEALVLATGMRERLFPFPGWTLPGVMSAGAALALFKCDRQLQDKRVVIAGTGLVSLRVAAHLIRAGAPITALAPLHPFRHLVNHPLTFATDLSPALQRLGYTFTVMRSRTPQLPRYVPVLVTGTQQVENVTLAKIDSQGHIIAGSEKRFDADTLICHYGFEANYELAAMLGAELRYDTLSGWCPRTDTDGQTTLPGVFACGDVARFCGSTIARINGHAVGTTAAAHALGGDHQRKKPDPPYRDFKRMQHRAHQRALGKSLSVPVELWNIASSDTILCRCEGVRKQQVHDALLQGHVSLNAIKCNTRCGMGWCGGRYCLQSVATLITRETGQSPRSPMTTRAPVRPVSLSALANAESIGAQTDL